MKTCSQCKSQYADNLSVCPKCGSSHTEVSESKKPVNERMYD